MARVFNGTSDRIDIANETAFDIERTQAFSLAGWLKLASASDGTIVGKMESSGTFRGWAFGPAANGKLRFDLHSDDATNNYLLLDTVGSLPLGVPTHVGVTYDGSSTAAGVVIYVNGVAVSTSTLVDGLTATILNNLPVQLGCRGGTTSPGFFLAGQLTDVGVWTAVLSSGDMSALFTGNQPTDVQASNLVSGWDMRANVGSPEPDLKGANAGTLVGTSFVTGPNLAREILSVAYPAHGPGPF